MGGDGNVPTNTDLQTHAFVSLESRVLMKLHPHLVIFERYCYEKFTDFLCFCKYNLQYECYYLTLAL